MELTKFQISRQDYVDGTIHNLMCSLADKWDGEIKHDIEMIGKIRNAFKVVIVDDLELMTEQEFYPFIVE